MKKGITIGAIIVMIGALITLFVGGFQSGKGNIEQLPVSLDGPVYGAPVDAGQVGPVWSVQVAWQRRLPVYVDTYGPTLHQIQLNKKPTLEDVKKYVPAPAYLPGKYAPLSVFNVVQIGPELPVEVPEKEK